MKPKYLQIALVFVVFLLIAGGVYAFFWKQQVLEKKGGEATWSVVYLSSGEIYVGKLTWGERPQLDNGYLIMKVASEKDPKSSNIRLQPLSEVVWAPITLALNPDHILFSGPLAQNSAAAQKLRDSGVLK